MPEIATADEIDQFVGLCESVMEGLVAARDYIIYAVTQPYDPTVFRLYDDLDLPPRLKDLYNCERRMLRDLVRHAEEHAGAVEKGFLERCGKFIREVDLSAQTAKQNLPTSIEEDLCVRHRAYLREVVSLHWTVLDIATREYGDLPGAAALIGDLRKALDQLKEFRCIFVSYASPDRDIVAAIREHTEKLLDMHHVFLWWYEKDSDSYDVQGVADARIENTAIWMAELSRRMASFDLALVLTSESYVKSAPCGFELETILRARNDRGLRILPIRLAKCALEDNAQVMGTEWLPKGDQRFRDLTPSQVEDLCVQTLAPSLVRVVTLLSDPKQVRKYLRDLKWLEEQPGGGAKAAAAN